MQQIVPSMNKTGIPGNKPGSSKVLVAHLDKELRLTAFNYEFKNGFEKLLNRKIYIGMSIPDELERNSDLVIFFSKGFREAIEKGFHSEIKQEKDGNTNIIFEVTFTSIIKNDQEPEVVLVAKDITEKTIHEKALREREERYQLLCRSTNDAIYEWNLLNDKFWWNDGIHTLFGYSNDDIVLTKNWWMDKICSSDREELNDKIKHNIKNDISFWTFEYQFKKSDGTYAHVVDRGYILFNNNWEPVRIIGAMMDISHQKKAEENLRKREAQFSSLLQNSSDIICVLDLSAAFSYVSPSVEKILGYAVEELIGKSRKNFLHPDDLLSFDKAFKEILSNNELFTIQSRFKHKDGHYVVLETTFTNLIEDPAVDGIVINSRDVTERISAQNALMKSEANLKESQRIAKLGSWECDVESKVMSWSDELFEIFGYKKKDGVPTLEQILESLAPESRLILSNALQNAVEKGEAYNIDYRRIVKSKVQHLNSICNPVKDSSGKLIKLQGIIMDISSRKETEEKLLESEEWFKTIFNTSRDGFIVELNDKIFFVNDALVQLFGYNLRGEILGSSITALIAEENIKTIDEYGKRRLNGEDIPTIYETKGRKKDGSVIDIEISASVFSIRGNNYIIASVRDITERKHAEKQLMEQNNELKKINSELDRFVYSASHDLRAPLVSVLGLTSLLKINESDSEKIKYLDLVTKSIHKLDRFIQEIIHHSRNSRVEVNADEIDFRNIIEETFEDLRYLDEARNIVTNIDILGQDKFYSDSGRISVLFNNLISNAIRYSYPEKRPPVININVAINKERAKIRISDNGQGIAQQHITRIFEMFYRASTKNVGSGLGLYIVKETLAKLQGEIQVYSTLGEGTTFELTLPTLLQQDESLL
jgi:PAS domain S-box-containing protein